MNWVSIRGIVRRDLTVVARSRAVVLPLVIVPVVFFVGLPALAVFGISAGGAELDELGELLALMPPALAEQLRGLDAQQMVIVWALEFQFISFFLIVPIMTAAVIAADSFAGEKERKTLEALVYTPTTDLELYVAKLLGPWLAAIAVSTAGYALFALVANLLAAGLVGRPVVLTANWLMVIAWLSPAVAALALGVLVQVSARVRGFQEAYQLGGVVVLPVVLLFVGQLMGALHLDLGMLAAAGLVVTAVAAAVVWVGFRSFRRERLLLSA